MRERAVDGVSALLDRDVSRRGALKALLGGGTVLGAGKAVDNVLVGYGEVVGTNLLEQDLAALANEGFQAGGSYWTPAGEYDIATVNDRVHVVDGNAVRASFDPRETTGAEARSVGEEFGVGDALAELAADLGAVAADEHAFEFHQSDAFFDRVADAETRPYTADALRRWRNRATPEQVERFAGASPEDPRAVLLGLVDGFREHAHYDVARYAAGSVQFNVLMNTVDVRAPFREPVSFEALLEDEDGTGMFCNEFTDRSIEALHAVPAPEQAVPTIGAFVLDRRHRHAYTAVATVIRDGGLVIPMTFVDYTHTTLYDDFALRGLMGEGLEAYNGRHRATEIRWG